MMPLSEEVLDPFLYVRHGQRVRQIRRTGRRTGREKTDRQFDSCYFYYSLPHFFNPKRLTTTLPPKKSRQCVRYSLRAHSVKRDENLQPHR